MPWRIRLAVVVGGAVGTLLRWAIANVSPAEGSLPIGTLVANLAGALLLGVAIGWLGPRRTEVRGLPILSGFLGAATTFSTFAVEVVDLVGPEPHVAASYLLVSITGGLLAVTVGRQLGTHWTTT